VVKAVQQPGWIYSRRCGYRHTNAAEASRRTITPVGQIAKDGGKCCAKFDAPEGLPFVEQLLETRDQPALEKMLEDNQALVNDQFMKR